MKRGAMQREPSPARVCLPFAPARRPLLAILAYAALLGCASEAVAQGARPVAAAPTVREEGVRWQSLTPAQREALAPLEHDWPTIEAVRKQKWLALAARFKSLPPQERVRIQTRMAEWAKLTPAERTQARLRFEEARQLPATDRSARWQEYQALSPEQRALLAARAASAPHEAASRPGRGARDSKEAKANLVPNPALAQPPRPVSPTLVQAAPGATTTLITRHPTPPPHQQSGMPKIATTSEFVQRSTLLPQRGPQAAAVVSGSASSSARTVAPLAARPSSSPPR
jgi:hypothetical protein